MTAATDALPAGAAEAVRLGADALFEMLARRLGENAGFGLLTVLVPDEEGTRLLRIYSSDEQNYPLGAADTVEDDRWFRQLFGRCEPVVANDEAAIAEWLPDYTDYVAQGYGSLANLPVVLGGKAIGILNLMAGRGHFTESRVAALGLELPLAALAILTSRVVLPTLAL